MQQIYEYILKISEIVNETPTVKVFRADLPGDANINFYPGSFSWFHFQMSLKYRKF